jgi:hypothetical protein
VERFEFVGRTSKKNDEYHTDTYRVSTYFRGELVAQVLRTIKVWKRYNKTVNDHRSGSHSRRLYNRSKDPKRARAGS